MRATRGSIARRVAALGLWLAAAALAIVACQQGGGLPPIDVIGEGDAIEYAFGVSGEVRSITLPGPEGEVTFDYEVIDGLAIVEGDIILGVAQELEDLSDRADRIDMIGPESSIISRELCWMLGAIELHCERYRWPNATVPYTFANDWEDPAIVGDEDYAMRTTIRAAMAEIEAVTAVRFVPRSSQGNYVRFRDADGCSSMVGRQGGRQDVNLSLRCNNTWVVAHEILHALGFNHEQSRSDRNDFVEIHWDNIEDDRKHNFARADYSWDRGAYDYDSLMHYHGFAFCIEDAAGNCLGPTITTVPPGTPIGQLSHLSATDIEAINHIYPGEPPTIDITSPDAGEHFSRRSSTISFEADVVDPEGGPVTVTWTSDVSSLLGTGNPLVINTAAMAYGSHTVLARVIDQQGNTATDTVAVVIDNDPPSVDLYAPLPGTFCTGEAITFRATVIDLNESGFTLPDGSVAWRVDGGGTFATGKTISHAFGSAGSFQVVVRATDPVGAYAEDSVGIGVVSCAGNAPPSVDITTPSGYTKVYYEGYDDVRDQWYADVTFVGTATDPEDGPLTGSDLVWTTDATSQAPLLGTGSPLTARLYSEDLNPSSIVHTVTLTARDSGGLTRTDVVQVELWTVY